MTRSLPTPTLWLSCVVLIACAAQTPGEDPPANAFYFPMNVVVHTTDAGRLAYVLNGNFDLRYNAGWIQAVNLDAWTGGASDTASLFGQQLKLPSLGAGMAYDAESKLLVTTHRGTPVLAIVEVDDAGRLSCGDPDATKGLDGALERTDCDRRHLIELAPRGDTTETFAGREQPAGAMRDPVSAVFFKQEDRTLLLVSFVSAGRASNGVIQSPLLVFEVNHAALASGEGDILVPNASLTPPFSGVDALVEHPLSTPAQPLLAGVSRAVSSGSERSSAYRFVFDPEANPTFADLAVFRLAGLAGGEEMADLVFKPTTGAYAYGANNTPDAIVVFDTSLVNQTVARAEGTALVQVPRFNFLAATPLSGRPTGLAYLTRPSGDVLVATMFDSDELFVLAVSGQDVVPMARVDNIGAGPMALTALDATTLIVLSFFDHAVSLVTVPEDDVLGAAHASSLKNPDTGVANDQRR